MKEYIKDGMKAVCISLLGIIIATVIIFLFINILNYKSDEIIKVPDETIKAPEPAVKTIIKF